MTSSARSESYQYDAVGNRIHQVVNGVATNFAYAAGSNRLASASASGGISAAYGYNAYGSTTTINGVTVYTYDPFGRLANAGGATFEISAEDQRLRKAFGGNVTYFVPGAGGALLAENVNGTWKDYVCLNGRPVAMVTNGTVYSVHADQTGRAMALTAPNQSVTWASRNDPFDRSTVTGSAALFPLGFPGQYLDAEDSLWHNGFRDYDPKTGRYIQSDPIGLGGGVNTYAYVGGNPVMQIDPLGLAPPSIPQPVVNFCAGLGDSLLFGFGDDLRGALGIDGGIDQSSDAYLVGEVASFAAGGTRIAYAGGAKLLSIAPGVTGRIANAGRNGMKLAARGGAFPNYRMYAYDQMLSRYGSDVAVKAAAGRTNSALNTAGAAAAGGATANHAQCDCKK